MSAADSHIKVAEDILARPSQNPTEALAYATVSVALSLRELTNEVNAVGDAITAAGRDTDDNLLSAVGDIETVLEKVVDAIDAVDV